MHINIQIVKLHFRNQTILNFAESSAVFYHTQGVFVIKPPFTESLTYET